MTVRAFQLMHGLNLNAPVDGVRPDRTFANVIAVDTDARSHIDQLSTSVNMNLAGPGRAGQQRWNWRRTNMRLTYWLAKIDNNTDGAFSVSPTGTLATEWAPAPNDRRHRVSAGINSQFLRNLNTNLSVASTTGTPYTITTGFDDNGDSIFNDRPLGIGRNSVRTDSQATWIASASYTVRMGVPRPSSAQEHQRERAGNNAPGDTRYRLTFNVNVTNLANHANFVGYSGVMTSPFFLQPTAVFNPRKVDIGISFGF
jgi:hypothetical protein